MVMNDDEITSSGRNYDAFFSDVSDVSDVGGGIW